MNRENLIKLATYMEGLPADYPHFHMRWYVTETVDDEDSAGMTYEIAQYALKNGGVAQLGCGSAACAVGHAPAAGILVPEHFVVGSLVVWYSFATATFGFDVYNWCFDAEWERFDNSHYGAAARIRYVLAHGVPDELDDGVFDQDIDLSEWVSAYARYRVDA